LLPPKIARLIGLGAYAAGAGLALLGAFLLYVSRPTPRGGMEPTLAIIAWISLGGMFVALIAAHVVLGRRLLDLARDVQELP
jgi:hypothetical protein